MSETKNIYQKIAEVKQMIIEIDTPKDGKNPHLRYNYFTIETIVPIVTKLCTKVGLLSNFQLLEDNFGLYGELTIVNIDKPEEQIKVVHRTGLGDEVKEVKTVKGSEETSIVQKGVIMDNKAVGVSQTYGKCITYSHRYLLQNTFGIVDNSLDFDNGDTKTEVKSNNTSNNKNGNGGGCITESQVRLFWARAKEYGFSKDDVTVALNARGLTSVTEIKMADFNSWLDKMKEAKSKQ